MSIGQEQGAHRTDHRADRLERMFDGARGCMALVEGPDHRLTMANRAFLDLVGSRSIIGLPVADALPELVEQGFTNWLAQVTETGQPSVCRGMPIHVTSPSGVSEERFLDLTFEPLDQSEAAIFVQGFDVTEQRRGEMVRTAHNQVLELAIGDSPLEETLAKLIQIVESTSQTGVLGSILLLDEDGRHLRSGAAPSLPPAYSAALDGAEIGPAVGSCGTAAFTARPVFVSDIDTDPLWADFRELAQAHGLRACWSTPILIGNRKVLGTFAMYHREPREPTVRDLALVDLITQTAALIIARHRAENALSAIGHASRRHSDQRSSAV